MCLENAKYRGTLGRNGGVQPVFVAKRKKKKKGQGGGGGGPALKIPLFQKVPLKEKGYFQKVPAPPLPATTMYNKGKAIILVFIF